MKHIDLFQEAIQHTVSNCTYRLRLNESSFSSMTVFCVNKSTGLQLNRSTAVFFLSFRMENIRPIQRIMFHDVDSKLLISHHLNGAENEFQRHCSITENWKEAVFCGLDKVQQRVCIISLHSRKRKEKTSAFVFMLTP